MRKGLFLVLVFSMLSIGLASAAYKCSDNTPLIEEVGSMNVGERDVINRLPIGLSMAQEIGALDKMEAELLIDAKTITIHDENGSEVNFSDDSETFKLVNLTSEYATLDVGSETRTVTRGDVYLISGIYTMMVSSEGVFPGSGSVDLLLGKSKILLSNTNKSADTVEYEDVPYLVELYAATDDDAMIIVKKCEDENATIMKIADPDPVPVNNSNSTINNSNQTGLNNSNSINNSLNQSNNQSNNNSNQDSQEDSKSDELVRYGFFVVIGLFAIVVIVLFIRYSRIRKFQPGE